MSQAAPRRLLPPTTAGPLWSLLDSATNHRTLRYDAGMTTGAPLDPTAELTRLRALTRAIGSPPPGRSVHVEPDAERMLEIEPDGERIEVVGSNALRTLARLGRLDLAMLVVLADAARVGEPPLSPTAIARRMGHPSCDGALARRIRGAGDRLAEPVILRISFDLVGRGRARPSFAAWADDDAGGYRLDAAWWPLAEAGWPAVDPTDLRTRARSLPGRRLVLWADLARRGGRSVEVDALGLEGVLGIESPRPRRRAALWAGAADDLAALLPGVSFRVDGPVARLETRS